jgi:hypothetical protein
MNIKDIITKGGVLPALLSNKLAAKDEEIEALKKQSQGPAGTQAVAGQGMKRGGKVSSASSRADGIAQRGKTKGTMVMCGGGMARKK